MVFGPPGFISYLPGDSIRDLFFKPQVGGHDSPLERVTFELTIPKRSRLQNCQVLNADEHVEA